MNYTGIYYTHECGHKSTKLQLAVEDWHRRSCRNCNRSQLTESDLTEEFTEFIETVDPENAILIYEGGISTSDSVFVSQDKFTVRWVDDEGIVKRFYIRVLDDGLEISDHGGWSQSTSKRTVVDETGATNVKVIRSVQVPKTGFSNLLVPDAHKKAVESFLEALEGNQ